MSGGPFRFVHASDFHLEQPLGGLAEIPDHLRDVLLDAPFVAAERTISAAIEEDVDFVVLSGGILHPHLSGTRPLVFLLEQFERLADHNIALYWASDQADVFRQLASIKKLPESVHLFSAGEVQIITHQRDAEPLVELFGKSQESKSNISAVDFRAVGKRCFSIAVAYGKAESKDLEKSNIDYWALGGTSRRKSLLSGRKVARYCGAPQGRSPQETGPRGCTIVSVDEAGTIRSRIIPTDFVRWSSERIELSANSSGEDIEHILHDRAQALSEDSPAQHHFVSWTIAGGRELSNRFRCEGLGEQLTHWLRNEFGHRDPAVWTVSLEAEFPVTLSAAMYEEETILGDFLRIVRGYQESNDPVDLESLMPPRLAAGVLSTATELRDKKTRSKILREVSLLGAELLSGQETTHPEGLE